jgi:hypothetical protein
MLWWDRAANDARLIEPSDADDEVDCRGDHLPRSIDTRVDLKHAAALVREATGVPLADRRGRSRATDGADARRVFVVITADSFEVRMPSTGTSTMPARKNHFPG